jgi:hypothetical protein
LRKVVAAGITAGLLTSLVATSAFAAPAGVKNASAVVVTSAGSVVPGGTSATAATVQFVEEETNSWPSATAYQFIRIWDSTAADTLQFTSVSVVASPGSLGPATASVVSAPAGTNNVIVVKIKDSDPFLKEAITVSFKIKAASTAAVGAALLTSGPGNWPVAATANDIAFWVGTVTETITLTGKVVAAASGTPFAVVVDPSFQTLNCRFQVPGTDFGGGLGGGVVGSLTVGGSSAITFGDPVAALTTYTVNQALGPVPNPITASATFPVPAQDVAWLGNFGILPRTLLANDPVTQVIPLAACPLSLFFLNSPVTVTKGANLEGFPNVVRPGYNNQVAGLITFDETNVGAIAAGSTITYTIISTTGVQFSGQPGLATGTYGSYNHSPEWLPAIPCLPLAPDCGLSAPILNPGRTTLTFTVNTASTLAPGWLDLVPHYDVASTVAAGTSISVGVTVSSGAIVNPASVVNAYVNNIIAPSAAQPTIYIGFNGQNTGMITFKESAAGWFTDGTGSNNKFWICIASGEEFTTAPWAVVTVGDLKLFAAVSTPSASLQGLFVANAPGCGGADAYLWNVYTASTVASTVEIRGTDPATGNTPLASGANNGPQVNVMNSLRPGTTQMLLVTTGYGPLGLVANAVRAYKNALTIAAVSIPYISAGATMAPAGNLTLTETQNGQLDAGTVICVEIVPRTSVTPETATRDVYLGAASTNDLPVITTNGNTSGLLAHQVEYFGQHACNEITSSTGAGITLGQTATAFAFQITQGSINALGSITISGIKYTALTNAVNGPVQLNIYTLACGLPPAQAIGGPGIGCSPANQESQGAVTNARIGVQPVGRLDISPVANANPNSPTFNQATAIVMRGQRVTLRGTFSGTYAGDLVEIWIKYGSAGTWARQTSRRIMPGGTFTYSPKVLATGYQYYKIMFVGSVANSSAISNVVRAYGK